MKVEAFSVVTLRYVLKDDQGNILDQSDENDLLTYMHGTEYLVPGLESAILNHEKGDEFSVVVKAEEGYGAYNEQLVHDIPRAHFGSDEPAVGDTFLAQTEEGALPVTIKSVNDDFVKVDGNHPLAGQDLYFDIEIVDVREPTPEEKDHKHVHLHGHCCHHHDHGEHEHGCCHHHDHEEDEHGCCHHHDHEEDEDGCCHHRDHEEDEHGCCHHHDHEEHKHGCCHHHEHE